MARVKSQRSGYAVIAHRVRSYTGRPRGAHFSGILSRILHYNAVRSRPDSRVARKRIEESPGSIGQGAR